VETRSANRAALAVLAGIVDLDVRVGAVGDRFRRAGGATFAAELDELLGTSPGRGPETDALLACAVWLLNDGERHLDALDGLAVAHGLAKLHALLEDGSAHRSLARGGRLPDVGLSEVAQVQRHAFVRFVETDAFDELAATRRERADLPASEWLALFMGALERHQQIVDGLADVRWGERPGATISRRSLLATELRAQITRFTRHPSPFAIGRLLRDRAVRLQDVVAIAARRPSTAGIVRALTTNTRWLARLEVRAAIVANPFTPLRVAMILAATCRGRLRRIPHGAVHPRVRGGAAV
jgi:hypothetical protein